jgi:Flp pilus assembly protein TadG
MFATLQSFSRGACLTLARFRSDTRGAVAVVMGLAVIPLIIAAGAALDSFRASSADAEVRAALDAAALAGAAANVNATEADRRKLAEDAFSINLKGKLAGSLEGSLKVMFEDGRITVAYQGNLPTTLMRVGGIDKMSVGASATAVMSQPARAEVAMVLDYSLSMDRRSDGEKKYVTMRKAAIKMVNELTGDGAADSIMFGLVPFSNMVYTELPAAMVIGGSGGTWEGCTQDREYPYNTRVSPPTANDATKWGQPLPSFGRRESQADYHCDGYRHNGSGFKAHDLVVRPLNTDHGATISQLRSMAPYGYTHIALGMEFGWHLLDPGVPFSARGFDDDKNKKFLVLLTDGEQTTPAFGSGGSRNVRNGEKNLETLCSNVKAAGITVVTIAFDLSDWATKNRLRNCSTDPAKHFYEAEDGGDLTAAFEEIQQQIAKAIYLSE